MKKDFFIRDASNLDVQQITDIIYGILNEYGLQPDPEGKDKDLEDIEENYFNHKGFFGVMVKGEENRIIGTFGLAYKNQWTCELRKMYLAKTERGKGLGKKMLSAAIDQAAQMKYKNIFLETVSPLKEAIALYKKYGFKEVVPSEVNKRCNMAFELTIS